MRTIAFLSEKGGVGKSTLCLNIAAVLGQELGRRVLIVDLDGNACISRTLTDIATMEDSLVSVLLGSKPLQEIVRPSFVANVSIAPGSIGLRTIDGRAVEPTGDGRVGADGLLSELALGVALRELQPGAFDYVLVDCPGGHAFMENAALLACDEVLLPTGPAIYDLYALEPTLLMIAQARELRGDGKPVFLGFLPNATGALGVPAAIAHLLTQFGAPLFSPVRLSSRLKTNPGMEAAARRVTVLAWPDTAVAASLRQVACELDQGLAAARALPALVGEPGSPAPAAGHG